MSILILGSKGQLGRDLLRKASSAGLTTIGLDLPQCDITDADSVRQAFGNNPGVQAAINAAAYTAVDLAEKEREKAYAVNARGPDILAQACRERDIPLIHLSTDYVFDGRAKRPYLPSDPVGPQSVYGKSKAEGEAAVRKACPAHIIVRTSWLFGLHGPNFVKTMLGLGKQREQLRVIDDQVGCPTYAADLAGALLAMASRAVEKLPHPAWGTYHYCNLGAISWYEFTRRILEYAAAYDQFAVKEILPITTEQYPLPAPRPRYSVLDCSLTEDVFGLTRRPFEEALKEMLAGLYGR